MQPDPALVSEMVRRIREVAEPIRVILFGSAGRGDMTPDSDLDVLVVVPDDFDQRQITRRVYRNLIGLAPLIGMVALGLRALVRWTPGASSEYSIGSEALGWLVPAITVLAVLPLGDACGCLKCGLLAMLMLLSICALLNAVLQLFGVRSRWWAFIILVLTVGQWLCQWVVGFEGKRVRPRRPRA